MSCGELPLREEDWQLYEATVKACKPITLQPRDLGPYDTLRQRHTVMMMQETESAWIAAVLYPVDLNPVSYPKYAWERIDATNNGD